jgi:hypothetical protein
MLAVFGQPNSVLDALLRAGANVNAQDRNRSKAIVGSPCWPDTQECIGANGTLN